MSVQIEFHLPFKPQQGALVLNELGERVGEVVGVEMMAGDRDQFLDDEGNQVHGPVFLITANVEEAAAKSKLQCLEPTFPTA